MPDTEIFVSWSKPGSHAVGEVVKEWLPKVLPGVKPWLSSEDITKGTPWFASISAQLRRSQVCVICITRENVESSWLYYEAGAIAHAMQGALICPYLVGVPAGRLAGTPLGQYQCTAIEKDDTWLLVKSINSRLDAPHDEQLLRGNFDAQWPAFQRQLSRIAAGLEVADDETEQETEDELSAEAENILIEASQDRHGYILAVLDTGGYHVQTNSKQLCEPQNPRMVAAYRSALNDLVSRELLDSRGSKGETFAVTDKGFKLADQLRHAKAAAPTAEANAPEAGPGYDRNDIMSMLETWLRRRTPDQNQEVIHFEELDKELRLPKGSAYKHLERAGRRSGYKIERKGKNTIKFKSVLDPVSETKQVDGGTTIDGGRF